MKVIRQIMLDEWRYWYRSKLALVLINLALVLSVASVAVNYFETKEAEHERTHLQEDAEARFLDQPDRHPHRMVHYGHYVFRTPSPLSIIEPGVDSFAGTSIFLEGHRQNSAMFSEQRQSAGLTRFSSLSPAFVMQIIIPLFIILIGYSSMTREREMGTLNVILSQGVSSRQVILGKFAAIAACGFIAILPLGLASLYASLDGESLLISAVFTAFYFIYLLLWAGITIAVSAFYQRGHSSFTTLIGIWILFCILIPRIGSSTAAALVPIPGKLERDFAVYEEVKKLGNGHNASDPAFNNLKKKLLETYNVEDVSKLPINFRGVIAQFSEKRLTAVLNKFAEQRMSDELAQAQIARRFAWLSPTVAMRNVSTLLSGTSLETHHRFLREAEALRFEFVQSLNKIHEESISFQADASKYQDENTAKSAKVDASNWNILSSFSFSVESMSIRMERSVPYLIQFVFWCGLAFSLLRFAERRVRI